jgi:3-oxosteroid 1-dehydrogenase
LSIVVADRRFSTRTDGVPVPGLCAAGNVMASVIGMTYGGAGGTLAPAMVFGYLRGRHAARAAARVVMAT